MFFVPQISSYLKQCKFMKIEPYVTLFPVEHIETNDSYTHALTYLSTFVCIPGKHVQSMFHTCFTVKQMSHIGCTYVTGHMCLTYVAAFSIHVFCGICVLILGYVGTTFEFGFVCTARSWIYWQFFPSKLISDFWPEPAGAHVAWFRRIPGKCIGWNLLLFVSILFLIALLMTTRGWPVFSTTQIWVLPTKNIRLPSIAMGSEG